MIRIESIETYDGPALSKGPAHVYLPPHPSLAPYISNYTVTFPSIGGMPEDYTVLPTASATLCYSIGKHSIADGLRGVNTKATVVGARANQFDFLLLIEFHPAGLFPLVGVPQSELLDDSFRIGDVHAGLNRRIRAALYACDDIASLRGELDRIFLFCFADVSKHPLLFSVMAGIKKSRGTLNSRALSQAFFISERQLERIFKQHVGTSVKTFSRIVRVNCAIHLLQKAGHDAAAVAANAGYYDQPHFIHDFRSLCGVTPQQYLKRMSVFYNDAFKL